MSKAFMHVLNANGQWVPAQTAGTTGVGFGGGGGGSNGLPSGIPLTVAPWSYAAGSGGITNTSDVVLKAAAGIGRSNYLVSLQVVNSHASVATEVVVKDGSTVIWRAEFAALGLVPTNIVFERPLIGSQNTALNAACVTTGSKTYINAQGYQDVALSVLQDQQTSEIELYDGLGNVLTDGAGSPLTVPYYVAT